MEQVWNVLYKSEKEKKGKIRNWVSFDLKESARECSRYSIIDEIGKFETGSVEEMYD